MKKIMLICFLVLFTAAPAMANFMVDIGTQAGEEGYTMNEWGPVQPTTSGGGWGGIATDLDSYDNLCRTVWGRPDYDTTDWAEITFPKAICSVTIRHLDGGSDDSFKVEVDGNPWGSYPADPKSEEFWTTSSYSGLCGTTLRLTCTGIAGPYYTGYGQLGIDWVEATPIPAPGAILLGSIGIGLVGYLRRRRTI
jgi:hypothetical protein